MFIAHSSDSKRDIPVQDYSAHINGVVLLANQAAKGVAQYALTDGELLKTAVHIAAEFHDLGKLDEDNQKVLSGRRKEKHLPVQHTDAGTAYLLNELGYAVSAALVRSHHIGLPDFIEEQNRDEKYVFRDNNVFERVNRTLSELIRKHKEARLSSFDFNQGPFGIGGDSSLFFRIALSCLADGDHTDTAAYYHNQNANEPLISLKPAERLKVLDRYVETLKEDNDRSQLRSEVYSASRNADIVEDIASCDSPVGTGKTTSVMAHLLIQAQKRNLRRIFVVLPFTNIITQSVQVYREALVLPGEDPNFVVAELHHRADFQDIHSRQFTALWKAPIIVTTAVTFFETLSSNTPATLRRLHNLPGSAVFIDESHAALPAKLLPLAWSWIKGFAREWACYWVLASGSLNRFWKIEEFDETMPNVPEIIPDALRSRLAHYEKGRITYKFLETPLSVQDLIEWISTLPGPRIVILNTVQSAAVVGREYANRYGRQNVEHMSTALTPFDREQTLQKVKDRLNDNSDTEWALIATSCVEAGVNLSFQTGVREASSLVSLLQIGGRVNRHGAGATSTVWTIVLQEAEPLKKNPGTADSSKVLIDIIREGIDISPNLCTDALKREVRLAGSFINDLQKWENDMRFPKIENKFRVIPDDARIVIIDGNVVSKLENHQSVDWRNVQNASVQIRSYRLEELRVPKVSGHPEMYKWPYPYDDFIGYMAGVLKMTNNPENFIF
jgi:CRISPR-associated endonuclease Cas3-HD